MVMMMLSRRAVDCADYVDYPCFYHHMYDYSSTTELKNVSSTRHLLLLAGSHATKTLRDLPAIPALAASSSDVCGWRPKGCGQHFSGLAGVGLVPVTRLLHVSCCWWCTYMHGTWLESSS